MIFQVSLTFTTMLGYKLMINQSARSALRDTMANLLIYILPFISMVFLLFKWLYSTQPTTTKNPPPSPPKLPIIGNLHQIGPMVHHSFQSLCQRYGGPLMLLHLGSVPALVVSSTESACQILQTHDLDFSSKPTIQTFKKLYFDYKEISVAPYGEYWRQAKKTIIVHFLSTKMVQMFSEMRNEETANAIREIEKLSQRNEVIDLSELLFLHSSGLTCRATFGRKYNEGATGKKFKKLLEDILAVLSRFYFTDSIPQLAWIDRIMGARKRVEAVAIDLDKFLDSAIEERLAKTQNQTNGLEVEPFIDALIRVHKEGFNGFTFDRDSVKALLMDAYLAGTDTTSSVLEWTMAELLTHPRILKKLQEEVRTVLNGKKYITEDDLEQMKYLKAVIMESTRLHPPIPIPPARVATRDVRVMGFDIAKGTRVYINIWAIGRDPNVWEKPDEFWPERFVEGCLDFVKHEFKFIPFGGGRRGCPGRVFSMAVIEQLLANMAWKFDWKLPDDAKEESVNMDDAIGIASHKKVPLLAYATACSCS